MIAASLILTHVIAFATGYYLCMKNTEPRQDFIHHGIPLTEQEKPGGKH